MKVPSLHSLATLASYKLQNQLRHEGLTENVHFHNVTSELSIILTRKA